MTRVTLIGLGSMGQALGRAFLDAGHELTVWNRTPGRARPLTARGAHSVGSTAAAVAASPVVVLCVTDHRAAAALLDDPAVAPLLEGRVVVELSGGEPGDAQRLADQVREQGASYLCGVIAAYPSDVGTDTAELRLAGPEPSYRICRDLLTALGQPRHLGPDLLVAAHLHQAQSAFLETTLAAFAEALAFGLVSGVPREQLFEFMPGTVRLVASAIDGAIGDLRRDATGRVPAANAALAVYACALDSAVATMQRTGARSALAEAAGAYLDEACRAGLGGDEIAALVGHLLNPAPRTAPGSD